MSQKVRNAKKYPPISAIPTSSSLKFEIPFPCPIFHS